MQPGCVQRPDACTRQACLSPGASNQLNCRLYRQMTNCVHALSLEEAMGTSSCRAEVTADDLLVRLRADVIGQGRYSSNLMLGDENSVVRPRHAEVGGRCARGERGGRGSIWRRGGHSQHPQPTHMRKHSSAKQEVGTLAEYRRPRRHCATK